MTSPSTQQIDREMSSAMNLESDLSVSGDEGLSDNTGSTTTETKVYVEYPGTGVVYLPENSCRAIFKGRRHPEDKASYICIRKDTCQKRVGGYHTKLRENDRATAGYYEGVYKDHVLTAALSDTKLTDSDVKDLTDNTRLADRAHASAIGAMIADKQISLTDNDSKDNALLGKRSVQAKLFAPTVDEAVKEEKLNAKLTDQAELLRLMSKLCLRMDNMEKGQEQAKTPSIEEPSSKFKLEGILRSGHNSDTKATHPVIESRQTALSQDRRTAANLMNMSGGDITDTGFARDGSKSTRKSHSNRAKKRIESSSDESDASWDNDLPHGNHKSQTTKATKGRLYAVAKGRGGTLSVGLYKESWDTISFLLDGYSSARYRRVKTEREGMDFINDFYKSKGLHRPSWMRSRHAHYPSLRKLHRHLGTVPVANSDNMSDSDVSMDSTSYHEDNHLSRTRTKKRKQKKRRDKEYDSDSNESTEEGTLAEEHIGVDPSLGKDNELFKVNTKNVNGLETGLGSPGLGKQTLRLLLEQIEDMTAYPRHSSTNTTEGIGELVEVVTNLKHQDQERQGGTIDTGWKHKNRNVLGSIKSPSDLSNVLTYLLEEQHTILETCAGNMESVLINANIDSKVATKIVASSLAFRISRDTLHSYFNLLNYLAGVNSTGGWELSKSQLIYHSGKLSLIRNKYRSRLQMVCQIYIYLREGQTKNWMSMKLHTDQLNSLTKRLNNGDTEIGGGARIPTYGPCSHCKTTIHGGGKNACPWKDETPADAKKKAKKVLIQIGNGNFNAAGANSGSG